MSKFKAIYDTKNAEIPVSYDIEPWATVGEFLEYLKTRVSDEVIVHILVLNRALVFEKVGSVTYENGKKNDASMLSYSLGRRIIRIEGTSKGLRETLQLLAI